MLIFYWDSTVSKTVPTVCCVIASFFIIKSFSVYKGANETAEMISVFVHKRKLLSDERNNCLRPM